MNCTKYINPVALVMQHDLVRACGRMPASVWEQHAVKLAGWMVIQMAASSRCEMHGACVIATSWVLYSYTSNWRRTQECARPSVNSRTRQMFAWLHHCSEQFLFILLLGVCAFVCAIMFSFCLSSLWGFSHTTHPRGIYKSILQNSESSLWCMGSICQILSDSLSQSHLSLSLYSFELVYYTV